MVPTSVSVPSLKTDAMQVEMKDVMQDFSSARDEFMKKFNDLKKKYETPGTLLTLRDGILGLNYEADELIKYIRKQKDKDGVRS